MPSQAPLETVHAQEPIRFPTLDAVRFFAFFAVFLSHAAPGAMSLLLSFDALAWVPRSFTKAHQGGGYGVDLFLVLSAFLITTLLLREQETTGTIRVRGFYMRRMLRIWPLYLAFLALMFVVDELVAPGVGKFHPIRDGYWVSFLALVGNWYVAFNDFPDGNISPLWSVSLEEQFYLFWPWLMLLFRKRLVLVAAWMIAISVTFRILMNDLPPPALWTMTVTRFDPIALGVLMAVGHSKGLLPKLSPAVQWGLFVGGFVSWPLIYSLFLSTNYLAWAIFTYPLAAFSAAGILLAAINSTGSLRRFLTGRWLTRMGTLSYGTYVLHYAMLSLAGLVALAVAPSIELIVTPILGFALTWGVAEVSYRYLEKPFLDLRKRFRPRAARAADAPSTAPAPSLKEPGAIEPVAP